MHFLLIIIIILYTLPALAEEVTLQDFTDKIESWVDELSGIVISSEGKQAIIDMGKNRNMVKGIPFEISRQGEELRHPITNEILGRKSEVITTGKIIKVDNKFSILSLNKAGVKKGDTIQFILPLKLKFSFKNMTPREENEIKFNILQNKNILEDSTALFQASCERIKEGDIEAKCIFKYGENIIFSQKSSVKGFKIIRTGDSNYTDSSFSKLAEIKVKGSYSSIAIGHLLGRDNPPTIALANNKKVIIYKYNTDGTLEEITDIGSFKEILNVEITDINNDSIDELLISNLDKEKSANSYIYVLDEKKATLLSKNIPLLFRTFYGDSQKVALCQEYSKGSYVGKIYKISLNKSNNEYRVNKEELDKINKTYAKLYGSAFTNQKQDFNDILYFNEKGALNMQDGMKAQYSIEYNLFGETNNFIMLKELVEDGVTVGTEGGGKGYFVNDYRSYATFIYQRIIRLSSGAYLMYTNIPKKRTEKLSKYEACRIGEYMFVKGKVNKLFEEEYKDSFIVEIDISSFDGIIAYLEDGAAGSMLRITKL